MLPLVLYNGVRRWQAPEEVAELVATVPGGLERYRPCLRYFLLDEGRFTEDDLAPLRLQRSEIRGPAGWGQAIFRGVLPHEGDSGFIGLFVNGGRF